MLSIKSIIYASLISCTVFFSQAANADIVYESKPYGAGEAQNSAFSSSPLNGPKFPSAVGESFTLNSTFQITGLNFYIDGFDSNQTIDVFFHALSDNPSTATPIYSQTFSFLQYTRKDNVIFGARGNTDNVNFTFTTPFSLNAGSYGVFLNETNNNKLSVSRFGPGLNCVNDSSNSCSSFTNFGNTQIQINADGSSIGNTGYASGMQLLGTSVSSVPEPEVMWLFAGGLPILLTFSRRKKSLLRLSK